MFQGPEDQAAKNSLRQTLRRWINRRDAPEMHGQLFIVLDYFEIGMLQAKPFASQAYFPENHQSLTRGYHFLDVMEVEPAQHERLAQRTRIRFFQRRFENLLPAPETEHPCFGDLSAKQDG